MDTGDRIKNAYEMLSCCELCERRCRVNRTAGEIGACGEDARIFAARAALHYWEEPCISGSEGSGTVFFSGCSLKCVFCQNREIAAGRWGKEISLTHLTDIYIELQHSGANNINLVTPTHYIPQIIKSIADARCAEDSYNEPLSIPVVYNTSSYETPEAMTLLDGTVDVYLADCKYHSTELSMRYSRCPDYFEAAFAALKKMYEQVGDPVFDERGMMQKGVIVRILLLPGCLIDAKHVIKKLYDAFGDHIYYSLMDQYTPTGKLEGFDELRRRVSQREYRSFTEYALSLGVKNGFVQGGESQSESFIPPFDYTGI